MSIHRCSINVPNPEATSVTARLRLDPIKRSALTGLSLELPEASLGVENAGLSLDPCATEGTRTMRLKLDARSSIDVFVIVNSRTDPRGKAAMSAFHLVDERAGRPNGGVTIACVDGIKPEREGRLVRSRNACPIVLASHPYPVARGSDPRNVPSSTAMITGSAMDWVAPITNPTRKVLLDVQIYLEHLGSCNAAFAPMTWNVGALMPKEVFYASWNIDATDGLVGAFTASLVVGSKNNDTVRLPGLFRIGKAPRPGKRAPRKLMAKTTGKGAT